MAGSEPKVGLFATCLVDLFRPTVGLAAVDLLEAAGCRVEVPRGQTDGRAKEIDETGGEEAHLGL